MGCWASRPAGPAVHRVNTDRHSARYRAVYQTRSVCPRISLRYSMKAKQKQRDEQAKVKPCSTLSRLQSGRRSRTKSDFDMERVKTIKFKLIIIGVQRACNRPRIEHQRIIGKYGCISLRNEQLLKTKPFFVRLAYPLHR